MLRKYLLTRGRRARVAATHLPSLSSGRLSRRSITYRPGNHVPTAQRRRHHRTDPHRPDGGPRGRARPGDAGANPVATSPAPRPTCPLARPAGEAAGAPVGRHLVRSRLLPDRPPRLHRPRDRAHEERNERPGADGVLERTRRCRAPEQELRRADRTESSGDTSSAPPPPSRPAASPASRTSPPRRASPPSPRPARAADDARERPGRAASHGCDPGLSRRRRHGGGPRFEPRELERRRARPRGRAGDLHRLHDAHELRRADPGSRWRT
jgi:hypothetical protein